MDHDTEQLELMGHIDFAPIEGHSHLYVADVSEEDEIILNLLGIFRDPTITSDFSKINGITRFLYKSDDKYLIIEISHASSSNDT